MLTSELIHHKLPEFVGFLRYERRLSSHSIKAYEGDVLQFLSFLKDINHIGEIQLSDFRKWLIFMMNNHVSARSIHRKFSALNTFLNYLLSKAEIKSNQLHYLKLPKLGKRLPGFLTPNQAFQLLDAEDDDHDMAIMHQCISELLYQCGFRRSEILNLTHTNIDLVNRQIKVTGKGKKERIVPIGASLTALLENYIEIAVHLCNKDLNKLLFVTPKGNKLYPEYINRLMAKNGQKIGMKITPHQLRHSFATHLLDNGAELIAIKELMGHGNLSATQEYLHSKITELKKVYKNAKKTTKISNPENHN